MTRIKNINGTSDTNCKCGSWLKHWEKLSRETVAICSEEHCYHSDLVGAHVQKADSNDKSWYIVPLCKAHSSSKKELNVLKTLVPASRTETCEKVEVPA